MKFVISQELDGKWTWHLHTDGGKKLAASIPRFASWEDCESVVSFIRSNRFAVVLTESTAAAFGETKVDLIGSDINSPINSAHRLP